MNDNQRWGLFLILTSALIVFGCGLAAYLQRIGWFKAVREYWLTPVFAAPAGRHATRNLPRPGPTEDPGTPTGPGQPGWTEDDQATETWLHGLPTWGNDDELPGMWEHADFTGGEDDPVIEYDAEPPPGAEVLLPVQGDWLPVKYEPPVDDTLIDYGQQPHAGPAAWHSVRSNPRTHFADPGWQWDGTTFIKEPSRVPWIRELETRPLRAIEAAVA